MFAEEPRDPGCSGIECPTGSVCSETRDGPFCFCPPGYTGRPPHCEPLTSSNLGMITC